MTALFYTGDVAAAVVDVVRGRWPAGPADLAAYRVIERVPVVPIAT